MDRYAKQHELEAGQPCALITDAQHGPILHDMNQAALAEGLQRSQRVVDAKALCPQLATPQADLRGDAQALKRLAAWCRRWSPWAAGDGQDGILLDATGCAHLFGGEADMLGQIEGRLKSLGLKVHTAIAPTRGAAWAIARYGTGARHVADGHIVKALSPLPIAALRIGREAELLLRRVGLKTIGQLIEVPRAALTVRFGKGDLNTLSKRDGPHPLLRLDQALGVRDEPLSPMAHRPRLRVMQPLLEPIAHVDGVNAVLEGLCARLCDLLNDAGQGTRAVKLEGYRVDGGRQAVYAAASQPSRSAAHIQRLFKDKLESMDAGFGFDALALEAVRAEALNAVTTDFSGRAALDGDAFQLLDRLSAKLGPCAVLRPMLRESHIPENAQRWVSALEYRPPLKPARQHVAIRPHRLFEPPEEIQVTYGIPEDPPRAFVWRRRAHRTARVQGPERLAPEWWHAGKRTRLRDYYRVEDEAGLRFWLFRYGLYGDGRSESAPRWFLHGLFG